MTGLRRMNKERRGAGAGQRRRDLARDMTGFADAADHHAALATEHDFRGSHKILIEPIGQFADRARLDLKDAPA